MLFCLEPLTQTKPQVANLKAMPKTMVNKKMDSENDASPVRNAAVGSAAAALQKNIKKPVAGSPALGKPAAGGVAANKGPLR